MFRNNMFDIVSLQDSWVSTTGYKKSTLLAKTVTQDTSYECTFVINGKDYKMNVDADVVGKYLASSLNHLI